MDTSSTAFKVCAGIIVIGVIWGVLRLFGVL